MNKPAKLLIGAATLWPVLYMFFFFAMIFMSFFLISTSGGQGSGLPFPFQIIVPLHLLTMLVIMGLTIFYMVDVFRNERIDKDKKVLWAVVLFLGNIIAMPIYWYLYIWKEFPKSQPQPLPLAPPDTTTWANTATGTRRAEYVPPREPPNWRE
jgi:hypothetical protein